MIRIRGGNFNYTDEEISAMIEEVKYFKDNHANGIVFGALTENYQIDINACMKILDACGKDMPATFHRAFDETSSDDIAKNVKIIEELGFTRILTSGLEATAKLGIENIKKMMNQTEKLIIMPGSGLNTNNVQFIVDHTGCKEIHGSARTEKDISTRISVGGTKLYVCDRIKVEELKKLL
jgi:copper homeostasis protein